MKKIKTLFSLTLLVMLVGGCAKNDSPNYAELLNGTWVNTLVNEQLVLPDDTFIMELKADHSEMYATGYQVDENNKMWEEGSNYSYSLNGNLVTIEGNDVHGNTYYMEFNILLLNQEEFTYKEQIYKLNGETVGDVATYTCKRVTQDFSAEFIGVWYGRCTSEGTTDSLYHYWEYFADGSYNYYYQDENSNWIKKSDNEGRCFLYGNLMASNYSNDLISGDTGLAYECWNFSLDGNNMVWTGLRENNVTITYEMEKVSSPPETLQ
ncbi:MAG: hypothetical protein KKF98_03180 [Bacteroidetes bacterium]|nr:hypothetical protein [Bacteroidota bacterium]